MTMTEARRFPPEADGGIRNLQVGCGPEHIRSNWWNTDLREFPGIDETLDAAKPWRWDSLLDHVYAEHFLEHLALDDAVRFLVNAGQALRVGGHIRLSTPALEWVMRSHFRFATPGSREQILDTLRTNRAFHGWGHRFLYSRGMLQWLLETMNYIDVRFCNYGQSTVPAFQGIEMHGGFAVTDGYPSVWTVEATRGAAPISLPQPAMALLREHFLKQVQGGH
jgi:predicted SAM-dependent methyltransferase